MLRLKGRNDEVVLDARSQRPKGPAEQNLNTAGRTETSAKSVYYIAREDFAYKLEVSPTAMTQKSGSYQLYVEAIRTATEQDLGIIRHLHALENVRVVLRRNHRADELSAAFAAARPATPSAVARDEIHTLILLASQDRDRGAFDQALHKIEFAARLVENSWIETYSGSPDTIRYRMSGGLYELYQLYADILMQLHGISPEKGYDSLAWQVVERGHARASRERRAQSQIAGAVTTLRPELENQLQISRDRLGASIDRSLRTSRTIEDPQSADQADLIQKYRSAEQEAAASRSA